MAGHYIPNTRIAVDIWEELHERKIHFLTNFHETQTAGLSSKWKHKIFTSAANAKFLEEVVKVKPRFLKVLKVGRWYANTSAGSRHSFNVALIPSNHCPGSVMFLFEGSFGRILYTGHCRYKPSMLVDTLLAPLVASKNLDLMYVDNTFAAPECEFPTETECLKEVIKIIKANPGRRIVLGVSEEDGPLVLTCIARALKVKIVVGHEKYRLVQKMLADGQTCVFTDDPSCSFVHAVDLASVASEREKDESSVAILLTLECQFGEREFVNSGGRGVHIIPYSTHSSHSELASFVSQLRPRHVVPIVSDGLRTVVPRELYSLCRASADDATPTKRPQCAMPVPTASPGEGSGPDDQCGTDVSCRVEYSEEIVGGEKDVQENNLRKEGVAGEDYEGRCESDRSVWITCSTDVAVPEGTPPASGLCEPSSLPSTYTSALAASPAGANQASHAGEEESVVDCSRSSEIVFSSSDLSGVVLESPDQGPRGDVPRSSCEASPEQQFSDDDGEILRSVYLLPLGLRREMGYTLHADKTEYRLCKCGMSLVARQPRARTIVEESESDEESPCSAPNSRDVAQACARSQASEAVAASEGGSNTDLSNEDIVPGCNSRVSVLEQLHADCSRQGVGDLTDGPATGEGASGKADGSIRAPAPSNRVGSTPCQEGREAGAGEQPSVGEGSSSSHNNALSPLMADACTSTCNSAIATPCRVRETGSRKTPDVTEASPVPGRSSGGVGSSVSVNNVCNSPCPRENLFSEPAAGTEGVMIVESASSADCELVPTDASALDLADLDADLEGVHLQLQVSECLAKNTGEDFSLAAQKLKNNCWVVEYEVARSEAVCSDDDVDAYIRSVSRSVSSAPRNVCEVDDAPFNSLELPIQDARQDSVGVVEGSPDETRNQISKDFQAGKSVSVPSHDEMVADTSRDGSCNKNSTVLPNGYSIDVANSAASVPVSSSLSSTANTLPEKRERRKPTDSSRLPPKRKCRSQVGRQDTPPCSRRPKKSERTRANIVAMEGGNGSQSGSECEHPPASIQDTASSTAECSCGADEQGSASETTCKTKSVRKRTVNGMLIPEVVTVARFTPEAPHSTVELRGGASAGSSDEHSVPEGSGRNESAPAKGSPIVTLACPSHVCCIARDIGKTNANGDNAVCSLSGQLLSKPDTPRGARGVEVQCESRSVFEDADVPSSSTATVNVCAVDVSLQEQPGSVDNSVHVVVLDVTLDKPVATPDKCDEPRNGDGSARSCSADGVVIKDFWNSSGECDVGVEDFRLSTPTKLTSP